MKSDEILVIQSKACLKPEKLEQLRQDILRQKETGVIVLPNYVEVVIVSKDVDIQVKKEVSSNEQCW